MPVSIFAVMEDGASKCSGMDAGLIFVVMEGGINTRQ
jgi:hypothetical protein